MLSALSPYVRSADLTHKSMCLLLSLCSAAHTWISLFTHLLPQAFTGGVEASKGSGEDADMAAANKEGAKLTMLNRLGEM